MSALLYDLPGLPDIASMMDQAAPLCGLQDRRGGKKMLDLHILKLVERLESS